MIETWGFHEDIQGHQPHNDDDNKEENNEVEDNDKHDDNIRDDTDDKRILAQRLDRDLGFLLGHQRNQPHDYDNDKVELSERALARGSPSQPTKPNYYKILIT